jgi:shikimate kinase
VNSVLIGVKAAGKTTAGKRLAQLRQCEFYDSDVVALQLFNETNGLSLTVTELVVQYGLAVWRQYETVALKSLRQIDAAVIATGGSAAYYHTSLVQELGQLLYLYIDYPCFVQRIEQIEPRPLFLTQPADMQRYYTERDRLYSAIADRVMS